MCFINNFLRSCFVPNKATWVALLREVTLFGVHKTLIVPKRADWTEDTSARKN